MAFRPGSNATSPAAPTHGGLMEGKNRWVNVTWMPHASLSQTSHVSIMVRSVLASLDELTHFQPEEWQVQVTIHGIAGLDLVPVPSATRTAPLTSMRREAKEEEITEDLLEQDWVPQVSNMTHMCQLQSLLSIPIRWRDLPRDSYLKFVVLVHNKDVLYDATFPIFNSYGRMNTGLVRLQLHPPRSDASLSTVNPGLEPPPRGSEAKEWQETDLVWKSSRMMDQLQVFEDSRTDNTRPTGGSAQSRAFGQIPSVPWLDQMARAFCSDTLEEAKKKSAHHAVYGAEESKAFLIVELPTFEVPVMHEETFYPVPQNGPSGSVTPLDLALHRKKNEGNNGIPAFDPLNMIPFLDYEDENNNPVEDKYRTLAHDLLRGLVDPALKPDRVQRDRLAAIIASPSHHPSREEKDLLWRFRFSLVDNRRALTKFLLAVDWTMESEVVQAAELLEQWRKRSPIEVTDALKLLGKQVAYQTNLVRAYAIDTLAAAPDEELSIYLLQLVQALKFENIQETGVSQPTALGSSSVSSLATFLIGRACRNTHLANYLYWYLKVELQDPTHGARYREIFAEFQRSLSETPLDGVGKTSWSQSSDTSLSISEAGKETLATPFKSIVDSVSKIGNSLRGADSPHDTSERSRNEMTKSLWDMLSAQDMFISGIMDAQMSCGTKAKKDAKETHLRSILEKEGYDRSSKRDPFILPCAPEVIVNGINPKNAKIFKSAVYPALVEFHIESITDKADFGESSNPRLGKGPGGSPVARTSSYSSTYKVIVKTGDDLRQDQLAMMMIKLMDGLLKRASLDLCLTAYSIIATSPSSGIMEFVDKSLPLSAILANNNNSILQFFQTVAPQSEAKYGVRPDIMSNYIRSCAGCCVVTYILGVGDRHLDNILITDSGHFFHIDFGFMFGRDPKPLPPAFRLTREMVEGMGGLDSTEYRQFCSLACQAFNAIRKHVGLVLNLLHLMSDAGIEDLSNNPSADADGVIAKVEERFRLDLTDEQAERYFLNLINECLAAIAPRLMDVFHSIAVARR